MNTHETELVPLTRLKPHPKNYKRHPDEQLDHIAHSIQEHGFYRNVVVARDYTILAGHGVVQAVERLGLLGPADIPVIRLDIDPDDARALKVMASDNEVGKLAETDDRLLTSLLKDVNDLDDLLGTGFDPQSLSALVMTSRPVEEVHDKNEAAEWVGMPEFDEGKPYCRLTLFFETVEQRDELVKQLGIRIGGSNRYTAGSTWSGWWPPRLRKNDCINVLFSEDEVDG